jgi:hypothetical protein
MIRFLNRSRLFGTNLARLNDQKVLEWFILQAGASE